MGTIHAMLAHVFFCEHYYADMLQNKNPDIPELTRLYHRMMEQPVADLCRFGCDARQRLADFAVAADEEQLKASVAIPYPPDHPTTGSKRKLLAHVLMHSTRHLAQLATVLRQQGRKTDWEHDLLFYAAIE